MNRPRASWWSAGAIVLVVVACVAPWWPLFDVLPWGADATKWVGRGSLNADWWGWVFHRKHFVGYRPVTALSFVLNHATTGYAAWGYRLTDLCAHTLGMLALLGVWRAWTKDRSWIGLVPLLLVLAHPATEEIVPYSTRRSYVLATAFGLAALLAHARGQRSEQRFAAWSMLAAGSLFLAVLSNEVAYVLLPVGLLHAVIATPAGERKKALLGWLPAVATCGLAVLQRHEVLEVWGGGYQKRFFAVWINGVPKWKELQSWRPDLIFLDCVRYTFVPHGVDGSGPVLPFGWARDTGAVLAGVWLAWVGVLRPLWRWREPERRLPLVLTAWWIGSTAIVVLSQTWFWRQSHALLLPLGLLCGVVLADALRDRRRSDLPGALGALGLLVLAIPFGSLAGGVHLSDHRLAIDGTKAVKQLELGLEQIDQGPALVWLAAPAAGSAAHVTRLWGDRLGEDKQLHFRLLAYLKPGVPLERAELKLVDGELVPGRVWLIPAELKVPPAKHPGAIPIDATFQPWAQRTWVLGIGKDGPVVAEAHRGTGPKLVVSGQKPAEPESDDEGSDQP